MIVQVRTDLAPGVEFEIFKGSNFLVPDPAAEPGGVVSVDLESGHLAVSTDPQAGTRVELDTGNRMLRTLEDGTSFVICQAPDKATCLYVIEGAVEWSDDFDTAIYAAGEGTFAEPGEGPKPPRCDVGMTATDWVEESQAGGETVALPVLVGEMPECRVVPPTTTTTSTTLARTEAQPPSGEGMVLVSITEPVIGTEDFARRPENYREPEAIEGPIDFYIDERAVSNRDFRKWVVSVAQNDPEEWKRLVPNNWLVGLEGVETQADYPSGEDDVAVTGIRWATAEEYCRGSDKHLATEIEWELAAVGGYLQDLKEGRQDWVSEPGEYGDEPPEGERMLRGNNNTLQLDLYYRLSVVDSEESTATRQGARIRCAESDAEAPTIETFGTEEFTDDFLSLESGWPTVDEELFAFGYHPPSAYHLESRREHTRGAVVRDAGRRLDDVVVEAVVFIQRDRVSADSGNYRFGVTVGSRETGYLLFDVQPDEADGGRHDWCVSLMGDRLRTMLADVNLAWFQAPTIAEGHEGEFFLEGLESGSIDVANIDDPLTMTIKVTGNGVVVAVNGNELATVDVSVAVDSYGFFLQTYNKDTVHIHYDRIDVTVP